eukprot:541484-Pelagomonas_calceolata.AAC.1
MKSQFDVEGGGGRDAMLSEVAATQGNAAVSQCISKETGGWQQHEQTQQHEIRVDLIFAVGFGRMTLCFSNRDAVVLEAFMGRDRGDGRQHQSEHFNR